MHRRCPKCETRWPQDMEFCPHDATPLEAPKGLAGSQTPLAVIAVDGACRQIKVGDRLGPYRLLSVLGEGGMGTVYEAEHEMLGRKVAIKALLPDFIGQPDILQRFFKEAQAVNQIRHSCIIDITDFVEGGEYPPYMVMELLDGQDLADYIDRYAPLAPELATNIAVQMCDAMGAVHALSVVHRDLKPENIFVLPGEESAVRIKLLDFGIAKFLATDDAFLMTRTGEIIGTPEYMAPEQVRGMKVDHRVDIYAAGIILYEMLTGRHAFRGNLKDLLHAQLNETPPAPSTVVGEEMPPIPGWLDDVVLKAMAKSAADRFQTMDEMRAALESHSRPDVRDEPPATEQIVAPEPAAGSRRLPRWVLPVAGATLAVAVGTAGLWAFTWREESADRADRRGLASRGEASGRGSERPSSRKVEVVSKPGGADIYSVETGELIGRTPTAVALPTTDSGRTKSLRLKLSGHRDELVSVGPNTQGPVVVVLRAEAAPDGSPSQPAREQTRPFPRDENRAETAHRDRAKANRDRAKANRGRAKANGRKRRRRPRKKPTTTRPPARRESRPRLGVESDTTTVNPFEGG